jgi:hypothetical protein
VPLLKITEEIAEHFRLREGYRESERRKARADLASRCNSDPGYLRWLNADLRNAREVTAAVIAILAAKKDHREYIQARDVLQVLQEVERAEKRAEQQRA